MWWRRCLFSHGDDRERFVADLARSGFRRTRAVTIFGILSHCFAPVCSSPAGASRGRTSFGCESLAKSRERAAIELCSLSSIALEKVSERPRHLAVHLLDGHWQLSHVRRVRRFQPAAAASFGCSLWHLQTHARRWSAE